MNYHDVGKRIREERKKQKLSQEQLAEKVDISVTHMSHIETGNTKLSLATFMKIANALQTGTDVLLCDNSVRAKTIYHNQIADLLHDCTETQIRIIADIVQAAKISLDKHTK